MESDESICSHTDIGHSDHVLESHVGQKYENSAVDVHYAILVHVLTEIYSTEQKGYHLRKFNVHRSG